MPGYEMTYHGDGFEVKITADTTVKLSVLRGAIRTGLQGFNVTGISDGERSVQICECVKVSKAQTTSGT